MEESLQAEEITKTDMNDSGLGRDESNSAKKQISMGPDDGVQLLDLPDVVLLYILKNCTPQDLKALGYTCTRLGNLVLDRTLWERVDARSHPVGVRRMDWFLNHAITAATTEFLVSGYAKEVEGCCFKDSDVHYQVEEEYMNPFCYQATPENNPGPSVEPTEQNRPADMRGMRRLLDYGGPVVEIYDSVQDLSNLSTIHLRMMRRPNGIDNKVSSSDGCPGPQYTIIRSALMAIESQCPKLTSLALEYCNIDCSDIQIHDFPKTLKKLSLRGTICFNVSMAKTFLYRVDETLKDLEELNVSECEWVKPCVFIPVSKLPALRRLYMRECVNMVECVAYSAIATRSGFKSLQVLDFRKSPMGDAGLTSFAWLASLEELYVSPAQRRKDPLAQRGEVLTHEHRELEPWEEQEPDYYSSKSCKPSADEEDTAEAAYEKRKRAFCADANSSYESVRDQTRNGGTEPKKPRRGGFNDGAGSSASPHLPGVLSLAEHERSKLITKIINERRATINASVTRNLYVDRSAPQAEMAVRLGEDRAPAAAVDVQDRQQSPLNRRLVVNLDRQMHFMYRLMIPLYENLHPLGAASRRHCNVTYAMRDEDPASLVSDTAVHQFGQADTDAVNYIYIGPAAGSRPGGVSATSRPERSNLRVLYMRGFRNITDRSLVHLATAAPWLTLIDFRDTRVTQRGVENFKIIRPDCEVLYGASEPNEKP